MQKVLRIWPLDFRMQRKKEIFEQRIKKQGFIKERKRRRKEKAGSIVSNGKSV